MTTNKDKIAWERGPSARMATYDSWFKSAARELPAETLDPYGVEQFRGAAYHGYPL